MMKYAEIYEKIKEKIKTTPRKTMLIYGAVCLAILLLICKMWPYSDESG